MVALPKDLARPSRKSLPTHLLMHVMWFGAAALFVTMLILTYGLDLSPGLF
jgi:ribose/xylose/arabinose/galactoside ABC-type transport system permease subunit